MVSVDIPVAGNSNDKASRALTRIDADLETMRRELDDVRTLKIWTCKWKAHKYICMAFPLLRPKDTEVESQPVVNHIKDAELQTLARFYHTTSTTSTPETVQITRPQICVDLKLEYTQREVSSRGLSLPEDTGGVKSSLLNSLITTVAVKMASYLAVKTKIKQNSKMLRKSAYQYHQSELMRI